MQVTTVSVVPVQNNPHKDTYDVTLAITQAQPGCKLKITADGPIVGGPTSVTPSGTTATVTLTLKAKGGDHITKITVTSTCKPKEKASTQVRLARGHLEGPSSCKRKESCRIEAENYPPNSTVVFTATRAGSAPIVITTTTDSKGKAAVNFKFPDSGAWAIVGASGGESHTWWVQVPGSDKSDEHKGKDDKNKDDKNH
jgi:hypothetical protein